MDNLKFKNTLFKELIRLSLFFLVPFVVSISSCNKLLEVDARHSVNEGKKWEDINDARASLMGVYGLLRTALAEGNAFWLYGDLRQGDFISDSRRDLQQVVNGELNSSSSLLVQLSNWRKFYAVINAANIFIEQSAAVVSKDKQYTENNWRIDVAQARALKGLTYFFLARIWGDVPIWDKAYEDRFPQMKQSSAEEVLSYAERELKASLNELPYRYGSPNDEIYPVEKYHGSSSGTWDGVLLNRVSVYAILAHLNAWTGNYLEASRYSEYVLSNGSKAVANYISSIDLTAANGFFYKSSNSQLVAFPFKWSALEASFDGHLEQLTLAAPLVPKPIPDLYIPSPRIVSIFTDYGDTRFSVGADGTIRSSYFSEFSSVRPLFSKIKVIRGGVTDGSFPLFSSIMVFTRMEDMALLRAEALYVLGDHSLARDLLNNIRSSRGMRAVTADKNLLEEIFAERRRELMGEGHRWYDLVRYYKITASNEAFTKLIHDKGIFWPIASEVLTSNRKLTQNPYWN